ncbi:MAG: DedA family protein [Syntrophomonas sp.]
MELLLNGADFIINLDQHLVEIIYRYGVWATLLLFAIIFCETGLVITPFLPGDSLLFVLGALGAGGAINIGLFTVVLVIAAVTGNMVNYQIGRFVGPKIFDKEGAWFFKKEHLIRTQRFYERHGGKTIIISRFIPIIRTFAPFVAGIGRMKYSRFVSYNLAGGTLWVTLFVVGGYYFGNIPIVEKNFSLVILGIIFVSLIPAFISFVYKGHTSQENAFNEDR